MTPKIKKKTIGILSTIQSTLKIRTSIPTKLDNKHKPQAVIFKQVETCGKRLTR
jgi:hypothetical protein